MTDIDRVREMYAKAAVAAVAAYRQFPSTAVARDVADELAKRAKHALEGLDEQSLLQLVGEKTVLPSEEQKAA